MAKLNFFGFLSDAKGNIYRQQRVVVLEVGTLNFETATRTDKNGRFTLNIEAGQYDIYKGINKEISNPFGKKNNINFIGTIEV